MGRLAVNGVSKIYGERDAPDSVVALHDVTFEVPDNHFCSILGHSGCGKTTLLNIAAGFERATTGAVMVDGASIDLPGWRNTMIFQDYALFPWMSVFENIVFGLEMKGVSRQEREDVTRHYVGLVGLEAFEAKFPHQLSGGMRQRVAIARALATEPDVLLMDEPFAALDAQTRDLLHDELERIWRETGRTIIFVTHNVREAIRLGDRVILLTFRPGRVKSEFPVELPRPRHLEDPNVARAARQILDELRDEINQSLEAEYNDGVKPHVKTAVEGGFQP